MILLLAVHWIAPAYIAANAAQEDSTAGYAGVFYPLIIGVELVSGFLLWLLWDRLQVLKQNGKSIPGIETNGEREYE